MSMTSPTKFYRDSNYIVDVVMWPKFGGNPSISIREIIINSIL